jgi:hypothetical protein
MRFDFEKELVFDKTGKEIGYLEPTYNAMNWRVLLYAESGPPIHWGVAFPTP